MCLNGEKFRIIKIAKKCLSCLSGVEQFYQGMLGQKQGNASKYVCMFCAPNVLSILEFLGDVE